MSQHQKHAKLTRPKIGTFGRNEWAILGTPCGQIKEMAFQLTKMLANTYKVAYVDADHQSADAEAAQGRDQQSVLAYGGNMEFTDKITFSRFDYQQSFNDYQIKTLFNEQDLVLVNGNHFEAMHQMVVIDPRKSLEKKLHKLTNVSMFVLQAGVDEVPAYLQAHLSQKARPPIFRIGEMEKIAAFIRMEMGKNVAALHALVLAGGRSRRMKKDKGLLNYHGKAQRAYAYELLQSLGIEQVYMSCRADQLNELSADFATLSDKLEGLGPFGGIASAFQAQPDAAWLVIACDLPFLSEKSLSYLISHRNPSKIATSFQSPVNEFPEPLITIWEPRSYPVLLHFLSMGYSCPRKVLINSDIELLQAPDGEELTNVNRPEEYEAALKKFRLSHSDTKGH